MRTFNSWCNSNWCGGYKWKPLHNRYSVDMKILLASSVSPSFNYNSRCKLIVKSCGESRKWREKNWKILMREWINYCSLDSFNIWRGCLIGISSLCKCSTLASTRLYQLIFFNLPFLWNCFHKLFFLEAENRMK